ncbi:tripartite motif-containing protein 2-like [Acanthaster planci]|uniref:Tripartite motif-containing protein 2-like n=1 Tax=Acanthaster planci TaxID=133434 RepID=A0A8B7Z3T8_ACAPL|nr:tripartite motif-containing protein 2-like [Acanthaster planci]XP_022099623.1 tripartite motif-containing protein 2-like [Acanthaster planci]XP_022099624.1 tripartite motif-containing protein 2-like [Acanthaster planci]
MTSYSAMQLSTELRDVFLTCPLCLGRYLKPKQLPCQHTFCTRCLFKWFNARPIRAKNLQCPVCRESVPIPAAGIQTLPDSMLVVSFMEFLDRKFETNESVSSSLVGLVHQFGVKGAAEGQLCKPLGVAVSGDTEHVFVADYKNRIQVFDMDGKFLRKLVVKNLSKKFTPTFVGITRHLSMDGSERLVVSDINNKQVLVCDLQGRLLRQVGKHDLGMPGGAAVTSDGHIHVVDVYARVVRSYDRYGTPLRLLGRYGTSDNAFRHPKHIAATKSDDLVVTDCSSHTVHIFEMSGTLERAFGVRGKMDGEFRSPSGLAVDCEGNILVADIGNHCLLMFDINGRFIRRLDDPIDDLRHPESVAMAGDCKVAVTDTANHCIKFFSF